MWESFKFVTEFIYGQTNFPLKNIDFWQILAKKSDQWEFKIIPNKSAPILTLSHSPVATWYQCIRCASVVIAVTVVPPLCVVAPSLSAHAADR